MFTRKILKLWTALLLIFGLTATSHAALIDRGGGLIYDTDFNITWLQDANYAKTSGYDSDGAMNWNDAMSWADNLVYGGYSDWRLPTALNQDGSGPDWCQYGSCVPTGSEMGHLYNIEGVTPSTPGLFSNVQRWSYWFGTEYASNPNYAWEFAFHNNEQVAHNFKSYALYAWAVRPGDSAAVPEPGSLFLLGTGLSGLAGLRRWRGRK